MISRKRTTALLAVVALAVIAGFTASTVRAATKATTLTIWADQDRKAAVTQLAQTWASSRGVTVNVVVHDFGKIRDDLGTVASADAPDVIMAAHDWTGQLAANGLVQPLVLSKAQKANFPAYTLNAFSYGTAIKRLYGVPTQIENIGLVVNTALVKVPTTFAQLEQEALAYRATARGAPVEAPTRNTGRKYEFGSARFGCSISVMSVCTATSAIWAIGCSTVVSEGTVHVAASMPSKPTIES